MSGTATGHVTHDPAICGGKPCVAGTRIRVQDIYVWHELQGTSADEIVSRFPQLTMSDVYAALAYYWDHRDDIQRQMLEESAFVEEMKRKHPSVLKERLAGQDVANDSISSG